MQVFKKKQLDQTKRICLRLKEAREKAGMSLSELSQKTKINKQHLISIEECRFKDIPHATIYQKNFIKHYALALGLPEKEILTQFIVEETDGQTPFGSAQNKEKNKKIKTTRLSNFPYFFKLASITILILSLVGYISWQIRYTINPPQLTLYSPQNGFVTSQNEITVRGKTNKETQVSVNGKTITSDKEGQFTETVNLSLGINTITVSAKKKHGKSATVVRHVTLKNGQVLSYGL